MYCQTNYSSFRAPKGTQKPYGFLDWTEGDIAFLKPWNQIKDETTDEQFRKFSKAMRNQHGACGHPVIILKASPDGSHFAVTTISAYSSSQENNYLAPWKQPCHSRKQKKDFRSFLGSEHANSRSTLLLENDGRTPKPEVSWVYIQSVFVVPSMALKTFTKARDHLRLTPESLKDLKAHMMAENRHFAFMLQTLETGSVAPSPITWSRGQGRKSTDSSDSNFNSNPYSSSSLTFSSSSCSTSQCAIGPGPRTWAKVAA